MVRITAIALLLALTASCGSSDPDRSRSTTTRPSTEVCDAVREAVMDPERASSGTAILYLLEEIRREHADTLEDDALLRSELDAAIDEFEANVVTKGGSATRFEQLVETCSERLTGTSVPTTTSTTTTTAPERDPRPDAGERLQFRSVLEVATAQARLSAPGCEPPTATTTSVAAACTEAVLSTLESVPEGSIVVTSEDGLLAYVLGPVGFDGSALASAVAVEQETWVVEARVRDDRVDEANAAFNACYQGTPTCPAMSGDGRGAIAIVFDDAVISAPAVNGPDLGGDAFTISGDFTQADAEDLASSLFG